MVIVSQFHWAPSEEFALGHFDEFLIELHKIGREEMDHVAATLAPDERAKMMTDWMSASAT